MNQTLSKNLSDQLERRIAEESLELPMLPQVVTQVLSLVNDENSDMASLAKLIQTDPSLAGHVMRIANTAAFNAAAPMGSLQQAISRLGMRHITEIALAASMGPTLFKTQGYEALVKDIWQSSLATGVWAREIARGRRQNVDGAFLCGLLVQIGKPAVLQSVLEIAHEMEIELDDAMLNDLITQYQSPVGAMLAQKWQLPALVLETIIGINDTDALTALNETTKNNIDSVRAAGVIANKTLFDDEVEMQSLVVHPAIIAVNFYTEDIERLLDKLDAVRETIEALQV